MDDMELILSYVKYLRPLYSEESILTNENFSVLIKNMDNADSIISILHMLERKDVFFIKTPGNLSVIFEHANALTEEYILQKLERSFSAYGSSELLEEDIVRYSATHKITRDEDEVVELKSPRTAPR